MKSGLFKDRVEFSEEVEVFRSGPGFCLGKVY